jgi:hypothetical protein
LKRTFIGTVEISLEPLPNFSQATLRKAATVVASPPLILIEQSFARPHESSPEPVEKRHDKLLEKIRLAGDFKQQRVCHRRI